jgi:hypothetical protein
MKKDTSESSKRTALVNNIEQQLLFSSPELKAQVSSSDRPSSVRLSVTFYIFDFFSRTTWPILTILSTDHSWVKGIQVQMKGIAFLQG